ncbi:MAG: hypothetical protein K6T75_03075 [Acetobacteraceae bacterium]|nr:hypothetical protein [Acetobacteraceae bacterium]
MGQSGVSLSRRERPFCCRGRRRSPLLRPPALPAVALGLALALALAGLGAGGCRPGPAPIPPAPEAGPVQGGTLVVAVPQDPDGLDPHKTVAAATFEISVNIYDTLIAVDAGGNLQPGLAASWTSSPDGLTWTFKLRPDIYFHNGRKLVASDVKASFERILDPATAHSRASDYAVIERIDAPDPETVVFHLKEYHAAFLSNLAMGWAAVVPVEAAAELKTHPIGTGPFRLVEWVPNQHIKLQRFDRYFIRGVPYLDEVIFKIIPDDSVQTVSLKTGEVDVVPNLPPEAAADVANNPTLKLYTAPMNMVQIMAINNARAPFNDRRVRQALSYSVDKLDVIDGASWGYGTAIGSHMPPVSPYYLDLSYRYPRDLERARALLAEAGLPQGFSCVLSLPQPYEIHRRAGEVIAGQLLEAGVRAELSVVEWGTWLEQIYRGRNYELTVIAHTGRLDPDPFLNRYTSSSKENYMNYNNPEYDRLVAEGARTLDPAARKSIYNRLQQMLCDDAVALYIQAPHAVIGLNRRVEGWQVFPINVLDLRRVYKRPQ